MSAICAIFVTAIVEILFMVIVCERIRTYRLPPFAIDFRAVAVSVCVMVARGFLAWRGIGGIDTSFVFAIAAVAAITDLLYGYVFDRVLIAGGTALVTAAAVRGGVVEAVLGAVGAAFIIAVPWALSRARGVGLGDVKLAGVLGCGLGLYGVLRAIWYAFVLGAVVSVGYIVMRRSARHDTLPFAPFLALGTMLSALGAAW